MKENEEGISNNTTATCNRRHYYVFLIERQVRLPYITIQYNNHTYVNRFLKRKIVIFCQKCEFDFCVSIVRGTTRSPHSSEPQCPSNSVQNLSF